MFLLPPFDWHSSTKGNNITGIMKFSVNFLALINLTRKNPINVKNWESHSYKCHTGVWWFVCEGVGGGVHCGPCHVMPLYLTVAVTRWDYKTSSIAATLHAVRPDIITELPPNATPIPPEPPVKIQRTFTRLNSDSLWSINKVKKKPSQRKLTKGQHQ